MRWFLLLLAVLALGCLAAESTKAPEAPPSPRQPPGPDVQPQQPPQSGVEQPTSEPQKLVGVSVRELLPATVMDYSNFTFRCSAGSCTGVYRSRLVGNNNSVQVDFREKSNSDLTCGSERQKFSEVQKNRTVVWCTTVDTKEKFSSHLWWSEQSIGYVSIFSEEATRAFPDAVRAKNSDLAANNTAGYILGRIDYFASAGKTIVVGEA